MPLSPEMFDYAKSVLEVIVVNVILSGDNAVVIALAALHLPEDRRRQALALGGASAILTQFAFTLAISYLIQVPGLRLVGAMLLTWIACRLLRDDAVETSKPGASAGFGRTIANIVLANLVMSLDNAIAVAGASRQDPARIALGLVLSAAIILGFSSMLLQIVGRFRWVVFVGAGLLASTAAGLMWQDLESALSLARLPLAAVALRAGGTHGGYWALKALLVTVCLASPRWWPKPTDAWASSIVADG